MTQKIIRIGSSAGVTIPKKQLQELGLEVGDEIEIEIKEKSKRLNNFAKDLDKFMDLYDKDLKKPRKQMISYLTEEEILLTHFKLIERYGGTHGVRDIERVRSVIEAPKQEIFGREQYKNIFEKAAVYTRNIIGDHPFTDGNKRSGITTGAMFLLQNGQKFSANVGELEDFAVEIAVRKLDVPEISNWFKAHCN